MRAMFNLGFAIGQKHVNIKKPNSFLEFANMIYERLLEEYGEVIELIDEFQDLDASFNIETLREFLKGKDIIISRYKISLLIRYLNSINSIEKVVKIRISKPRDLSSFQISVLKTMGPATISKLLDISEKNFPLEKELILLGIFKLIREKRIEVRGEKDTLALIKNVLDNEIKELTIDDQHVIIKIDNIKEIEKIKKLAKKTHCAEVLKKTIKLKIKCLENIRALVKVW